jgi:hypothetical protein
MSDTQIQDLRRHLEAQREAAMKLLGDLTDDDLDYYYTDQTTGQEEGAFTVRRLLHRVITHHEDHLQHILKTRKMIGKPRSETQALLARLEVMRAELLGALIGLDDEDFNHDVANERELGNLRPDGLFPEQMAVEELYTMKRIAQHVVEKEEMRWGHLRQALDNRMAKA